jgi:hypothetical protein
MPSLSMCDTRVNVYPFVASQDADAGNDPAGNYPAAVATGVWACVQRTDVGAEEDETGRLTVHARWLVGFPGSYAVGAWGLIPGSRVDVLASDGVTVVQVIYTVLPVDGGGRGASWQVPCEERV